MAPHDSFARSGPNRKQNYKCKNCQRQFIENPTKKSVSKETKNLIDRLLLEKIPLAGIVRVTDVSEKFRSTIFYTFCGRTILIVVSSNLRTSWKACLSSCVFICYCATCFISRN